MSLDSIIPILSAVITIAAFVAGRISASRSDGKQDGAMLADIGYLKKGNDEILRKLETHDHKYNELAERVISIDESTKQAHKRINELREEMHKGAQS